MCEGLHSLGTTIVLSGPGAQWRPVEETGTQPWAWNLASSLLGRGLALHTPPASSLLWASPREARGPHGCPFKSVCLRLLRWGGGDGVGGMGCCADIKARPQWKGLEEAGESQGRWIPLYPGPPPAQTSGSTACPCREGSGWGPHGSAAGLCDLRPAHVCLCASAALSLPRNPGWDLLREEGFLGRTWGDGPWRPEQGARAGSCSNHTHCALPPTRGASKTLPLSVSPRTLRPAGQPSPSPQRLRSLRGKTLEVPPVLTPKLPARRPVSPPGAWVWREGTF